MGLKRVTGMVAGYYKDVKNPRNLEGVYLYDFNGKQAPWRITDVWDSRPIIEASGDRSFVVLLRNKKGESALGFALYDGGSLVRAEAVDTTWTREATSGEMFNWAYDFAVRLLEEDAKLDDSGDTGDDEYRDNPAKFTHPVRSYGDAKAFLGNMIERRIGHNTSVVRDYDSFAIRYHRTNIITFRPDGDVIVNTGGWHTRTTLDRIRYFLPWLELRVKDGRWEVPNEDGEMLPLLDGSRFTNEASPYRHNPDMADRGATIRYETAARRFTGTAEAFALAYPDLARRSVVVTRLSGWDTVRTYKVFMDQTAMWKWLNTGDNSRGARPVISDALK